MNHTIERNATTWESLYAAGSNDLRYPSEVLVRLAGRLWPSGQKRRVLDYGCGTGANAMHLASMGHRVVGVDVAPSAIERARSRASAMGAEAEFHVIEPGQRLPFGDAAFDAVVAWQVICYNDHAGWRAALDEIDRVASPGALVLVATAAPGDVSQVQAEPLDDGLYRSLVAGQEGCHLVIPEARGLPSLFPGRVLEVGEFSYRWGPIQARHWVITYRVPAPSGTGSAS